MSRAVKSYAIFIAVYFLLLGLFLATRHMNDFVPIWYLTISTKKLLVLIAVSAILTTIAFAIIRSRAILAALFVANIALPLRAHGDFYVLRFAPHTETLVVAKNNPYLDQTDEIRRIKKSSGSIDELRSRLSRSYLSGIVRGDHEKLATHAMLIVASLYDFGNRSLENKGRTGCVGTSEETGFKTIALSFLAYRDANIGCCTDFSAMLASFLDWLKVENSFVVMPGHVANRVRIEGQWHYVDASTTLIVKGLFADGDSAVKITYYPHPSDVYNFQNWLIRSISEDMHFVAGALKAAPTARATQVLTRIHK